MYLCRLATIEHVWTWALSLWMGKFVIWYLLLLSALDHWWYNTLYLNSFVDKIHIHSLWSQGGHGYYEPSSYLQIFDYGVSLLGLGFHWKHLWIPPPRVSDLGLRKICALSCQLTVDPPCVHEQLMNHISLNRKGQGVMQSHPLHKMCMDISKRPRYYAKQHPIPGLV